MDPTFRKRLDRRTFIALTGGLAGSLLTSCSGDETPDEDSDETESEASPTSVSEPTPTATAAPDPTPTLTPEPTATPEPEPPVAYWIAPKLREVDTTIRDRVVDAISFVAAGHDLDVVEVTEQGDASVFIEVPGDEQPEAVVVFGEALIPVAAPDQLASRLSPDQVRAMFDGSVANWIDVDGQDRAVVTVAYPSASSAGFTAQNQVASEDELSRLASEQPGLIAMVPRSAVTFHVQSIQVGETDPLRDELRRDGWPWWEQISVNLQPTIDEQVSGEIAEELEEINAGAIAPRRTMISSVGDVMLGRTIHTIMTRQGDWQAPFRLVDDELQRGDLTIGNLECVLTGSFAPPADPMTFSLMSFPDAASGLEFAGFDALSMANNHAMDFGVTGVVDTRAALEQHGIQHFGAGTNLAEARQPCILEYEGVTFALLGYDSISMGYAAATTESGGISPMIQEYVVEDVHNAREAADVVIPFFHWGIEYTLTPTQSDRQMAHAAIDAGADMVLGGHPHWVQGMEVYQDRPIFYALGNFVFDQEWSFETKQGLMLHLTFDGPSLVGYRLVPVLIEEFHRPRIVEDDVRATILNRYWESTATIADE